MSQILPLGTKNIQEKIREIKTNITIQTEEIKRLEDIIKILVLKIPSNDNSFDLLCGNIDMNIFNISLKECQFGHSNLENTLKNFENSYLEIIKINKSGKLSI